MKPEISEEVISGWRREFESQDSFEMHLSKRKNDNGEYSDDETYFTWIGYLAARKKAHSEREDAFKAFTLDLADRYEKEIEKLKEEIDFKDSQLKTREAVLRQEIENIKAELKAERLITDSVVVFADNYCWECDEECVQLKYEGDTCRHEDFFIRARSTVKNRRIVL